MRPLLRTIQKKKTTAENSIQVESEITSPALVLYCLSCCEVKLTSETPHPGHPCLDSFPASSHLKIAKKNWLPSPLVSDGYCSSAAHKSAGLGCLLKGGSGSKVGEPCPLAPPHARWHLKVSQAVKSSLSLCLPLSTSHHPTSLPNPTCVVTPCLPQSHPFSP